MKTNKSFTAVICFYYSNKDLKEEIYFRGILRMLRDKKMFFLIKNILISIVRFKRVVRFKRYNPEIYSILYGVSSRTQKKIINGNHKGLEYFAKSPMCTSAKKALLNESKAIKVFNLIGVKTMKKINIQGDFCYENVKGENYYNPNLIYKKCLMSYPITKKIKVSEYFKKVTNILDLNLENIIDLTISHGDLTVWNTKIDNDEVVYIDLERYQKFRIKFFDIFYYITSYLFFTLKSNPIEILKRTEFFIKENNIEKHYYDIFLVDLLNEKQQEVKDGFIYIERVNFINTIENLIILSK
jgi:hypothetical protein